MTTRIEPRGAVLSALRTADPARWRREIEAAVRRCAGGTSADVGAALGVSRATVNRWLEREPTLGAGLRRAPGRVPRLPQPTRAEATGEWDDETGE